MAYSSWLSSIRNRIYKAENCFSSIKTISHHTEQLFPDDKRVEEEVKEMEDLIISAEIEIVEVKRLIGIMKNEY